MSKRWNRADCVLLVATLFLAGSAAAPLQGSPMVPPRSDRSSTDSDGEGRNETASDRCNPNDPEVLFIKSTADWDALNDPGKRVFCVEPGDYRAIGQFIITTQGSSDRPRYLLLSDWQESKAIHPALSTEAKRAIVGPLTLQGAGWWVITGLTFRREDPGNLITLEASRNVKLVSLLIEGGGSGTGQLNVRPRNEGIIIRKSVFRNTVIRPWRDTHCIKIIGPSADIHLIENEVYNCAGDGIQIGNGNDPSTDIVEGLVIEANDFYLTAEFLSSCRGQLAQNGWCACAENAIDVKGTTAALDPVPPAKWAIIIGNRIWGFLRPDPLCGTSGGLATAVVFHWQLTDNVLFRDNVITDSAGGVALPDRSRGEFYSPSNGADHISIVNNIFYNIGDPSRDIIDDEFSGDYAINAAEAYQTEFVYNTIIGGKTYMRKLPKVSGMNEFQCNLLIKAGTDMYIWREPYTVSHDAYYNTSPIREEDLRDSLLKASESETGNSAFCFQRKRITGPETYCIPWARSAARSPHAQLCADRPAGRTPDVGVDDNAYTYPQAGAAELP